MFCRSCGTQNADDAPSCISCGNPLQNPYQASTPASGQVDAPAGKPDNYLIQSVLVTLCCCLPLGIVGIVFATRVDSLWNAGDFAGAHEAAANAKKFTMIGVVGGLIMTAIGIGLQILMFSSVAVQQGNL